MRVRGALHLHSVFSHDGTLSVAQVADFYARRGYQFIAFGEHSQDMDEAKVQRLVKESVAASSPEFLVLPGIEYTCQPRGMHILGLGALAITAQSNPAPMGRLIREHEGWAVLAHPRRLGWECAPEVLREVDAVGTWNVGYDSKYLPSVHAPGVFRKMKHVNPKLLGVAGHDLHREPGFYDVAMEMEVSQLTSQAVLRNLRVRAYQIRSRFFNTDPRFEISWARNACLRLAGRQLDYPRQARALALRWPA